ncbi:MAG: homocysteine S-methyltransferase family protein [Alphaproteobacteria bacterium]|nr:homocysteine S-methyltransferase family protein [Alphaproteobacteria bacterium SS10]
MADQNGQTTIDKLLSDHPFLLMDGGMGQELIKRGVSDRSKLWSAQALVDDPDMVLGVHRDFVSAGADLLITNSYATNPNRLRDFGMADQIGPMNRQAGELAQKAANEVDRPVLVAASLPPLNGSYRPDHTLPTETTIPLYQEMLEHLGPYVDLVLIETMSTAEEARGAAIASQDCGLPVWVSWTLRDDLSAKLRSGETIFEAVSHLEGLKVDGLIFNCSSPETLTAAMPALAAVEGRNDRPFGGYANGFTEIPSDWRFRDGVHQLSARRDLDPAAYAEHIASWYDQGARLLGGCCEVGPDHIRHLADWRDQMAKAA